MSEGEQVIPGDCTLFNHRHIQCSRPTACDVNMKRLGPQGTMDLANDTEKAAEARGLPMKALLAELIRRTQAGHYDEKGAA